MLGIFGGFLVLLLSFYVLYLGSIKSNILLTILGILLAAGSTVVIVVSRMKQNLYLLEQYKAAMRELAKNPEDTVLRDKAYTAGVEYYKSKRDNRTLLPMDEQAIHRDLMMAVKSEEK